MQSTSTRNVAQVVVQSSRICVQGPWICVQSTWICVQSESARTSPPPPCFALFILLLLFLQRHPFLFGPITVILLFDSLLRSLHSSSAFPPEASFPFRSNHCYP